MTEGKRHGKSSKKGKEGNEGRKRRKGKMMIETKERQG
jgi:hypothetical protein